MRAAVAPPRALEPPSMTAWPAAPRAPRAARTEVHVWLARLATTPATRCSLWNTLDSDERARALAFRFPLHRERFVAARGILRLILAQYLEEPPAHLRFALGAHGKPLLSRAGPDLRFNVSHSDELALYAVAQGHEVGVDIERMREDLPIEEIAQRYFCPAEVEALLGLSPALRTRAFFACWTRKEAYLKARGDGLTSPLDGFAVSITARDPAQLVEVQDAAGQSRRWSLHALTVDRRYQAAVAVEGLGWTLRQWQWSG